MLVDFSVYKMLVFIFLINLCLQDTRVFAGCQINCGVIQVDRNGVYLLDMAQDVWSQLQTTGQVDSELVAINFESLTMRTEMDWDTFAQAYMDLRSANVSAIIGPYAQPIVTSSERFAIPYFLSNNDTPKFYTPVNLITVFPSMTEINRICFHVIQKYYWQDVLVFYDSQDGAELIENLLTLPDLHVRAKKLDFDFSKADIRAFLLEMRHILITNFVIVANKFWTTTILNEALYVSMLSSRHSWIIPSLDLKNSELEPFGYTEVNLTSFNLVESDFAISHYRPHFSFFEYVSVYDALLTVYELTRIQIQNTGLCYTGTKQALMDTLQQILRRRVHSPKSDIKRLASMKTPGRKTKVDKAGATGKLSFREDGSRDGYIVQVMSLSVDGLYESGYWNSSIPEEEDRLSLDPDEMVTETSNEFPLGKEVVKVVTIEEPPFLLRKQGHEFYEGNDKYEGFCMDLLQQYAQILDFQYEVYLVPDGLFGSPDEFGNWNGVIGEIMNGNASLAVSPVTITSQREEVVDFAKPYKPRGLSLLMKKPKVGLTFFQFLDPLSPKVWGLMGVALIVVSFSMFIVDKLAPPEEPAKSLNAQECIWFTFASLVLNSTDILPRTVPGRILAGALWLFSLIIISTYTANLAAFLTISKFTTPINSVYDLGNQGKVKYGTVWSSATSDFFQYSQIDYFKDMWQFMAVIEPENMVNNTDEGFQRVRNSNGDYAFIWDDDVIVHEVNKDCELEKVGNSFDASKGYGVAMPKGALYRDTFSMTTLELGEDGILNQLEHKWWEPPICPDESNPTGNRRKSLEINGIAGVFIVLTAGIVLALIVAFIDYLRTATLRQKKSSNNKLLEEMNNVSKHNTFSNDVTIPPPELTNYVPMTPSGSKHTNIF